MPTRRLSTRSPALPTGHLPEHHPSGQSPLVLLCHGPREEEPSFAGGRFDALASCLLEGLRVRKGGVLLQYRPANKKLLLGVSLRLLFVAQGQVTSLYHVSYPPKVLKRVFLV